MLNERRASGFHYDAVTDVARIIVAEPAGTVRTRTVAADLLLDEQGFLVGVNVEPERPSRSVVMLGPHERVTQSVPARIGLCADAAGVVFELRVAEARATIRGNEKNPYT